MNSQLLCLICGAKTKGRRLKVISCRACAMFYYRSLKKASKFRCDGGTYHCTLLKKKGQLLCKYCRFHKCQQLGMDLNGGGRRAKIPTVRSAIDTNLDNLPNIEVNRNETLSKINNETKKIIIDLHSIEVIVKEILSTFSLYKNLSPTFFFIERAYVSMLHFGATFDDAYLLFDQFTAINLLTDDIRMSGVDLEEWAKVKPLWLPIRDRILNSILNPMKQIRITQVEVVYLLVYILFDHDLLCLKHDWNSIVEDIFQETATALHNYYTQDLKLSNYAYRMIKLNKIIEMAKEIQSHKKELSILSKIFDILHFEIIGSELSWAI